MAQVYKATYSGVPVYEFLTHNVAVMRRINDGWVNATHILKAANFDKPQRTRILERDVQKGVHQKIQGGYGKYQGTWVPLERAVAIAAQYDVDKLLQPLFDYRAKSQSPPPAPKHVNQISRVKAARSASLMSGDLAPPAPKRAKKAATLAIGERPIKRGRGRPPGSVNAAAKSQPPIAKVEQDSPSPPVTVADEENDASLSADSASVSSRSSSPSDFLSDSDIDAALNHGPNNNNTNSFNGRVPGGGSQQPDGSGASQIPQSPYVKGDNTYNGKGSISHRNFADSNDMIDQEYRNKLLDYFMAPDDDHIPEFLVNPPAGFNINQTIDEEGHTAFHWACAVGHLRIIEVLLSAGADINALNSLGQTPLMRSVMFTNNYDRRTFPKVVDLLRDTIFHTDSQKKTVLHHIAATTATRSKFSSARYYTEIILAKLSETHSMELLAAFIDRQDFNGDTSVHIAARNGARKCVKVLLSYNASVDGILNKDGLSAQDCIYQYESQRMQTQPPNAQALGMKSSSSPVGEGSSYLSNGAGSNRSRFLLSSSTPNSASKGGPTYHNMAGPYSGYYPQTNGLMAYPHISEVAIEATQRSVPAMAEYLEVLAKAYDSEIADKEADIEQVRQLLENMKHDISSIETSVKENETRLGDDKDVSNKLQEAQELVNARALQLRKLVERSQARDLAGTVREEEAKIENELQRELHDMQMKPDERQDLDEAVELAKELNLLQNQRKTQVDEIIELWATAGVGEKMNIYRRLVFLCCGVKMEEIDDLLDGIAQALAENSETVNGNKF